MTNSPPISIIIPAHNEEAYLPATLKSLCAQTLKPKEVIIVCNGCTDATAAIARQYYPSAIVLEKECANVSRARNEGGVQATGNILVFLDADSLLSPTALESLAREVGESRASAIAGTYLIKNDYEQAKDRAFTYLKNFVHSLMYVNFASGAILCSKKVFLKVGGFNQKLHAFEDGQFLRAALRSGARYLVVKDYVVTSMRRYAALGYWQNALFFTKNGLRLLAGHTPARPKPIR